MSGRIVILIVALGANGCGSSPTSPTVRNALLLHLTLSPSLTTLAVGRVQQFTANAVFDDGHAEPVAATWRSDNPQAAAVGEQGLVTPIGPGLATITASFGGRAAVLTLKVIQDVSGHWEGQGAATACQATVADRCASILRQPAARIALFVDQIDQQIRALVFVGGASFRTEVWADGIVSDSGAMTLTGEYRVEVLPQRFVLMRIANWSSTIQSDGTMAGTTVTLRESNVAQVETERIDIRFSALRRVRAGPALN